MKKLTLIQKIKEYLSPTICKKHRTKLKVHGWGNNKFCVKCFDEVGRYTYVTRKSQFWL